MNAEQVAPKDALEEAVSLFDELMAIVSKTKTGLACHADVVALHNRRQALEPRLARRRENQVKSERVNRALQRDKP